MKRGYAKVSPGAGSPWSKTRKYPKPLKKSYAGAGGGGSSSGVTAYTPITRALTTINAKHFAVVQGSQTNFAYIPSTGINASTYDICFAATQGYMIYSQGGGAWGQVGGTFTNASSLALVFQEYRCLSMTVRVMFSNNSASNTSGSTTGNALPIVYACEDRENANALTSDTAVLQYATRRIWQMGDTPDNNHPCSITVRRPTVFIANDNDNSFLGTLQASQLARGPWLSCGKNNSTGAPAVIPMGYVKMLVDPCGNTNSTSSGTFTFLFTCVFEYRGID